MPSEFEVARIPEHNLLPQVMTVAKSPGKVDEVAGIWRTPFDTERGLPTTDTN